MDIYSQLFSTFQTECDIHHTLAQCIASPVLLDPQYVAACAMASSMYKKLEPAKGNETLRARAIDLFKEMNSRCARWCVSDADLIEAVRRRIERDLESIQDFGWSDFLDHSGLITGKGAALKSRSCNTTFEKLFINRHFTTSVALKVELNRWYSRLNPRLLHAEKRRQILSGEVCTVVNYSVLSTVRKNSQVDRTICTEPGVNMIFQRALGEGLNLALGRSYSYNPALQPDRNRNLARVGSMDDSIATIDLSSASDTISYALCAAILPSWLMAAIDDCRCTHTSIDGSAVKLAMVSSMGNGFTFPLQTLIFSALLRVIAARRGVKFLRYDANDTSFGVFGDDIVCPSALFSDMIDALRALGFIPNAEKSFNGGYFRESCGTDWYNGYNVRGVYLRSLNSTSDMCSAFNRFMRWSAIHGRYIPETLAVLLVRGWRRYRVSFNDSDDAGYKVPTSFCRPNRHGIFSYKRFKRPQPKIKFLLIDKVRKDALMKPSHDNFDGWLLAALMPKPEDHSPGQLDIIESDLANGVLRRRPGDEAVHELRRATSVAWFNQLEYLCTTGSRHLEASWAFVLALV